MKLLIVVQHDFDLWKVPGWFIDEISTAFPQLDIIHKDDYQEIEEHLRDAEIVFTISLRPHQLEVARKLRWIHAPTAAVHQLLFPELVNSEIILTNSAEVHGPVVAENVLALILAVAKKIPQAARLQQERVWGQDAIWKSRPRELAGATLGMIGLGNIGLRVAGMASGFGMRVIALREHAEKGTPDGVEAVFAPSDLHDLLARSDFVVIAAPLTPATRGLMNEAALAAMKRDAFLINVGRGPQVDEVALADALRQRRIAGAALDVFEEEPLPGDSPLWQLDNLLITPHIGSLTEKLWPRHYESFSENLRRYLAHEPLLHVVDKHKGY